MSAFSKSFAPLLRTGRLAVRHRYGFNPVQQVFGRGLIEVRGLATVFERTKPHVNIGSESKLRHTWDSVDLNRNHWPC